MRITSRFGVGGTRSMASKMQPLEERIQKLEQSRKNNKKRSITLYLIISLTFILIACQDKINEAPLEGPNAGGYLSQADGIDGGFTIAHNVTIENIIDFRS